ncbi:MAG TPA: hypothetical protein VH583_19975 [Vicinamibacterales bacterium]|jgi:hypothetical protein
MTEPTLTPSRLWRTMTLEQRQRAALAFWSAEDAADDQMQAALLIAQQKKFRPKTIVSLDDARKARHLASMVALPEQLAARALVVYHLADQRAMMGAFLDALGIKHENGLIEEENVKPDPEKIGAAVEKIGQEFPADDVKLYLKTLLCQDPETWGALRERIEDDSERVGQRQSK